MPNASLTSTVSGLLDQELLAQTKSLVRREQQFTLLVIDHLQEIYSRRLHLRRGYASLFDYATGELGYSPAAAMRRIDAMELTAEVEGARQKLEDGSINLTAASQLQSAFKRQDRQARRARRAQSDGDGAAPAVPVLDGSARRALVEQAVGKSTREVDQLIAEVAPEAAVSRERVRPLGNGRWELKAVIDAECRRGLEELKALLSHTNPSMTYGELIGRLVSEARDRHDPGRRGSGRSSAPESAQVPAADDTPERNPESKPQATPVPTPKLESPPQATGGSAPNSQRQRPGPATSAPKRAPERPAASNSAPKPQRQPTGPATSAPRSRAIPSATKPKVWQRDGGRCRYVDPVSRRRCNSQHLLQIDHIKPVSLGGTADPDNLRLLWFAHHRHRHADSAHRRALPANR